jgi:hypothetical protein
MFSLIAGKTISRRGDGSSLRPAGFGSASRSQEEIRVVQATSYQGIVPANAGIHNPWHPHDEWRLLHC